MTDTKDISKDAAAPAVDTSINRFIVFNTLFYILNSAATYAVQFGWVNLPDNGTLSDKYQTILTPWGTSFSIWIAIFMYQLLWVIWQWLPSQRNSEGVMRAWYFYPIFSTFQAGWTYSFANEIMWLSLVCMYGILIALVSASMSLQKYKKKLGGYLLWQGPFSLQTGWIIAASAVNTNVLPVFYGASAQTQIIVASVTLAVLVTVHFSWLSSYPVDFAIPCVIVWALGGVYGELSGPRRDEPLQPIITETFSEKQISGMRTAVLVCLIVGGSGIIAKLLYVLLKQRPEALKAEQEKESASENSETEEPQESV